MSHRLCPAKLTKQKQEEAHAEFDQDASVQQARQVKSPPVVLSNAHEGGTSNQARKAQNQKEPVHGIAQGHKLQAARGEQQALPV